MSKKEREDKKKAFLAAMNETGGMIATSSERVGVSRMTILNWRKSDPEFDEQIRAIKDKTNEYVESQLMTLIRQGTPSAIYFYLKCQAGWRELPKQVEVSTPQAIDVKAALEQIKSELDKKDE